MSTRPYSETLHDAIKAPGVAVGYLAESWQESVNEQDNSIFLNALRKVAEAHVPDGGWLDISSAPKDGTHILLWNEDDGIHEGWWDKAEYDEGWYTFIVYSESWTHWRQMLATPDVCRKCGHKHDDSVDSIEPIV